MTTSHLNWLQEYPACPSEEFEKRRYNVLMKAGLAPASCELNTSLTAMSPPSNLAVTFHQGNNGTALEVKCEFIPQTLNNNTLAKIDKSSEERTGEDEGEDLHLYMNLWVSDFFAVDVKHKLLIKKNKKTHQ